MIGRKLDQNHYERVVGYAYNGKVAVTFGYYDSLGSDSNDQYYNIYTSYYEYAFITTDNTGPASITVTSMIFNTDAGNKYQFPSKTYTKKTFSVQDSHEYYIVDTKDVAHRVGRRYSDSTAKTVTYHFEFGDGTVVDGSFNWTYGRALPDDCKKMKDINLYIDGVNFNSLGTKNIVLGESFTIRLDYISSGVLYDVFLILLVYNDKGDIVWENIPLVTKLTTNATQTVSVPISVQSKLSTTSSSYLAQTVGVYTYGGDYTEYTKDLFTIESYAYPRPNDARIYLITPEALAPTVSISALEKTPGLPSGLTFFVTKRSTAEVRINASGQYGATIQSISSVFEGIQYNGSSFVTNTFGKTGNYIVTTTVTDSRGKVTTKTHTLTVKDWTEPKLTLCRGYRCASASDPTESPDGAFICVRCNGSVAPVDNENTMICTANYKAQESSSTSSATVGTTGYTMNQAYAIFPANIGSDYDITVVLRDRFTQTTYICARVPATGALIHIKKNKKGMGLFRRAPSNADGLYIAGNTDITGGLNVHGLIQADGTIVAQKTLNQMHAQALQQYNTATTPAADDYIPIISFKTSTGYMTLCAHPADGTMCVINYNSSSGQATVTSL